MCLSCFTDIFGETFRRLNRQGRVPEVFYPAVPIPTEEELKEAQRSWESVLSSDTAAFLRGKRVFLSINRFERKKVRSAGIGSLTFDWQKRAEAKMVDTAQTEGQYLAKHVEWRHERLPSCLSSGCVCLRNAARHVVLSHPLEERETPYCSSSY